MQRSVTTVHKRFFLLAGLYAVTFATAGLSVIKKSQKPEFSRTISDFRPSVELPIRATVEAVKLTPQELRIRLEKSAADERVEPLSVYLLKDGREVDAVTKKIGKTGLQKDLARYLKSRLETAGPLIPGSKRRYVTIDKAGFEFIAEDALANFLAKPHQKLSIIGSELQANRDVTWSFLAQIRPYHGNEQRQKIAHKLARGEDVSVDAEVLPEFARKMVTQYTIYRGPNCFHAALAFQGRELVRSAFFNPKEELGYHRAMINYDELWRTLNSSFYPVDIRKSSLKFGDIMVFFDVPDQYEAIDFRWIKHTAAYLFGKYSFSKGSKSANSPYTVKTLDEEWKTWSKVAKHLGVLVFRRNSAAFDKHPARDSDDWLY